MQKQNISEFNFEQCQKCAICTTVCPVLANNELYPGPKQAGPDGERYRMKNPVFYDEMLKFCLNCKRCEVACPSGVKVGDMIQNAKLTLGKRSHVLRDTMLASTDFVGPLASAFAPVANLALGMKPVKAVLDATIGVSKHRTMPKYSSQTFESWFKKNKQAEQDAYKNHISYYHGCYANYNFPQLGKDFVAVLNALGYGVHLLDKEECCGVAMISAGMLKQVKKKAQHNVDIMKTAVEAGRKIVTVSTSCTMTLRDEYPHLLEIDNSAVRDSIVLVEKFLYQVISKGDVKLVWKPDYKAKAAYHAPCHQERLGLGNFTIELLRMIPGMDLQLLDSHCCGMAGTYGFKKENYETSQKVGKELFDGIKAVNPDFVACECETCKWQIEMSTGYAVKNPVSILAEALDLEATAAANR